MTRDIYQIITDYTTFLDSWETNDKVDIERGAKYHHEAEKLGFRLEYVYPSIEEFIKNDPGHVEAKRIF